jgi:TetR/AcrR family transcriptional regulator, tetracycline repressor protein
LNDVKLSRADEGEATMRLDRERVVRTALRVLNEVGLEGLTLRRIAGELDVQAPALYWHVRNKQELLDEMATAILRDLLAVAAPPIPDAPWQQWILRSNRDLRAMLLSYRDGAKVFSGTYLTDDTLLQATELPLRKLTAAGFSVRDAAHGWATAYSYTIGFVIEEQAVQPRPGERDNRYDPSHRARRLDAERFPLALAAGQEVFTGFDERFDHGLELIIAGLEQALLARRLDHPS